LPSAEAIIRGLAKRQAPSPGYYIHTSGTLLLGWRSLREGYLGESRDKVYNDWDGIDELTSMPDDAAHRHVDKVVLAVAKQYPDKIKTAIVCPPIIYGKGKGTVLQFISTIPSFTKVSTRPQRYEVKDMRSSMS